MGTIGETTSRDYLPLAKIRSYITFMNDCIGLERPARIETLTTPSCTMMDKMGIFYGIPNLKRRPQPKPLLISYMSHKSVHFLKDPSNQSLLDEVTMCDLVKKPEQSVKEWFAKHSNQNICE
jgi:hypothetical protein